MLDIIFCNTAIEIPKKVNTKINTGITSNRGHRNRFEDAVVPPYGRMQEGYKAKDEKESSTHREHPLQGNSSHRHSRPSGNKDTRGNGDKCGDKKSLPDSVCPGGSHSKEAATYSPALHCSPIGASGLNFSVRNGKRWDPTAIAT